MSKIVSNSSPLIALAQVGRLDLLRELWGEVWIPSAVAREIAPTVTCPAWIVEKQLGNRSVASVLSAALDSGESEAVALAMELKSEWLLLDELPARRHALGISLPVVGTLGMLVLAKKRGLLPNVNPVLEALVQTGFHVSRRLYEQVLQSAGEGA